MRISDWSSDVCSSDLLITQQEKYNKAIDAWSQCGDRVANAMMGKIRAEPTDPKTGRLAPINSIYMMAHSGARRSQAQMQQRSGLRGRMSKQPGEIIQTQIISHFKTVQHTLENLNSPQ